MDKNTIINSHVNSHIDSLSVIYTNADNLINKLTELKLVISSMQIKPQVIAITEIKPKYLRNSLCKSEFNINGYNLHIKDLSDNTERGVLIYTAVGLTVTCIELSQDLKDHSYPHRVVTGSERSYFCKNSNR